MRRRLLPLLWLLTASAPCLPPTARGADEIAIHGHGTWVKEIVIPAATPDGKPLPLGGFHLFQENTRALVRSEDGQTAGLVDEDGTFLPGTRYSTAPYVITDVREWIPGKYFVSATADVGSGAKGTRLLSVTQTGEWKIEADLPTLNVSELSGQLEKSGALQVGFGRTGGGHSAVIQFDPANPTSKPTMLPTQGANLVPFGDGRRYITCSALSGHDPALLVEAGQLIRSGVSFGGLQDSFYGFEISLPLTTPTGVLALSEKQVLYFLGIGPDGSPTHQELMRGVERCIFSSMPRVAWLRDSKHFGMIDMTRLPLAVQDPLKKGPAAGIKFDDYRNYIYPIAETAQALLLEPSTGLWQVDADHPENLKLLVAKAVRVESLNGKIFAVQRLDQDGILLVDLRHPLSPLTTVLNGVKISSVGVNFDLAYCVGRQTSPLQSTDTIHTFDLRAGATEWRTGIGGVRDFLRMQVSPDRQHAWVIGGQQKQVSYALEEHDLRLARLDFTSSRLVPYPLADNFSRELSLAANDCAWLSFGDSIQAVSEQSISSAIKPYITLPLGISRLKTPTATPMASKNFRRAWITGPKGQAFVAGFDTDPGASLVAASLGGHKLTAKTGQEFEAGGRLVFQIDEATLARARQYGGSFELVAREKDSVKSKPVVGPYQLQPERIGEPIEMSTEFVQGGDRELRLRYTDRLGSDLTFTWPVFHVKPKSPPWWQEHWEWLCLPGAYLALFVVFWVLLKTSPLTILWLYEKAGIFEWIETLPSPGINKLLKNLGKAALLPWFLRQPELLDAWVAKNAGRLQQGFDNEMERTAPSAATASDGAAARPASYVPLPLRIETAKGMQDVQQPAPAHLEKVFAGPRCLVEIVGSGGSGKTTLAIRLAGWAMSEEPTDWPGGRRMLPVWIDEDTQDLPAVIRRKLASWLGKAPPDELFRALLENQRLLIIFDRLSERTAATRDHLHTIHATTPLNALLITTRIPLTFEAGKPARLLPLPLGAEGLQHFLSALLKSTGQTALFEDLQAQTALAKKFADTVYIQGVSVTVTPLLVRLFFDRVIELLSSGRSLDDLSSSIPELYCDYLRRLNPKSEAATNFLADDDMLRVAEVLGLLALGEKFVPQEFERIQAEERLLAAGGKDFTRIDPLQRLIDNGVLIRKTAFTTELLRFTMDPLADFLGAMAHARACGSDASNWQALVAILNTLGPRANGFRAAWCIVYRTYGLQLHWPENALDELHFTSTESAAPERDCAGQS